MDTLEIPELRRLACVPDRLTSDRVDAVKRSHQNYARRIAILGNRREELIKKFKEELSEIDREISHISDCVEACQQALSPINHVPSDILREIFLHLYLCFPRYSKNNDFSPLRPPIVISQVCRRWRAVTYDFASLWTKARTMSRTQKWNHTGLDLLSQWFQRAKGMPLDIQFVSTKRRSEETDSDELPVSVFIARLIEPIGGSLTHLLLMNVTFGDLPPLSLLQFPSLEQLVIALDEFAQNPSDAIPSFSNAPALRRVSFSGSLVEETDRKVMFPWDQLTHFICYNIPDYCDFFLLTDLPFCSQLRFLHLELHDGARDQSYLENLRAGQAPNRIVLPSLETLSLDFGGLELLHDESLLYPNIFFPFELPNLRSLQLSLDCIDRTIITPAFLDELRRLKNLEHLSITIDYRMIHWDPNPDIERPLRDIFQTLPSIKTLELSVTVECSDLLEHLTLSSRQALLPNLRTLALTFNRADHKEGFVTYKALTQFVNSRPQLKKITVLECDSEGYNLPEHATLEQVREILKSFGSRGLVHDIRRTTAMPSQRWIHVHPELRARPELLEFY